jgi:hypothetical protein
MLVERILEAVVIIVAVRTAMNLLAMPDDLPSLIRDVRARWIPVSAIAITAALVGGALLEAVWTGALHMLSRTSGGGWQALTAPFVQEGIAGAVFNLACALIVISLAAWVWGDWAAAAIWLIGAWAPIGELAHLAGYHVAAGNTVAYSAGCSGATYFTAGTLCAAMLLSATDRRRWLGLIAPVIGLLMWLGPDDGHGVVLVEGFVLGLALSLIYRLLGAHFRRVGPTIPARVGGLVCEPVS